jgi:hypothetical protein
MHGYAVPSRIIRGQVTKDALVLKSREGSTGVLTTPPSDPPFMRNGHNYQAAWFAG